MKLYITRHGRTKWNDEKRLQGYLDSPLTDEGVYMAKLLSKKISDYDIDFIASSDLKRAKDTSFYINNDKNIDILYFKELREMSFGNWEGMKLSDIYKNYPESFKKFEQDPLNYDNGSGETYKQLIFRVNKALDKIKSLNYKNVLIVTHGITVKALQIILENKNISDIINLPVIKGCSLIGYDIQNNKIKKIIDENKYDFIPTQK